MNRARLLVLLGWDPLGWVHDMSWYKDLLRAEWFRPIKPYWIRYHLDWVVAGLLILAAALTVRWLVRRRRLKVTFRERETRPLDAARKFLKLGERRLAAECFADAGEYKKAYKLYSEDQAWQQAAQMAERMGKVRETAELYVKANDPASAVRVLSRAGELEEAERILRGLGNLVEAAEMYLEAGRHVTAASLYREVGLLSRAAAILHDAGEELPAAECLREMVELSDSGFTRDEAEHMVRGANTFKQAGRLADSARLLGAIGEHAEAARRYLKVGEKKRAARCFEKAGELDKAVELYREADLPDEVTRLLERMRKQGVLQDERQYADALRSAGQSDRAAESYQRLGDIDAAVEASLEGDQPAQTAALLADSGRHHEAARMYLDAGDPASAREQFLQAHDRRGAAGAALQARMFFEAGEDFVQLGQWGRAVEALQQLEGNHPRYREAASLLGQSFARLGDRALALKMHQRAVSGLVPQRDNLDLFYQMARFLEESQQVSDRTEARKIYSGILGVHYMYKDVKARHDRLV